jgi:hypothetical protein
MEELGQLVQVNAALNSPMTFAIFVQSMVGRIDEGLH